MSKLFIPSVLFRIGTIGHITGQSSYDPGALVILEAVPEEGYIFLYWKEGETTIIDNPYSFNISTNRSIKAYFTTI